MSSEFFPSRAAASPTIYAYKDTNPQGTGGSLPAIIRV